MTQAIRTGHATREGTAKDNADSATVYTMADGSVGAAVIDGIGHGPHTSRTAPLLAEVAARYAAHRGAVQGILGAGLLVADPGPDGDEANAVGVVARTYGDGIRVAWVGDCRAYSWNGEQLALHTTDQTMARWVEQFGPPVDVTQAYGAWIRVSLATATIATVSEIEVTDPLVILTSDGVHDQTPHDVLVDLVREHAHDPQALADALVAAAQPDEAGYRDDSTAIVIHRPATG
ncbi:hypothetical protein ACFXAZ_38425 [Streptomyces sp. NPDC059477]|uniref:hypothetical protein n=1 Tax=Streptomyces sp. NPDC059477 TaxID=3346847 RepID=UPI0036B5553E